MEVTCKQNLKALTNDQLFDKWFKVLQMAIRPSLTDPERQELRQYKSSLHMEFRERGIDV